ncbi:Transcription elongation factor 1 homolog [Linum perenne]
MGKRKSSASKKMNAKRPKIEKLDTEFDCPFCSNPKSVTCVFHKEDKIAQVRCFVCRESFCTRMSNLTEAIDVYTEWIDACVAVNASAVEEEDDRVPEFRRRRRSSPPSAAAVC